MAGTMFSMSCIPQMATLVSYPENRGKWSSAGLVCISKQSLPDDPIGTTTVTFSGVKAGTEIRVYLPNGTEVAGVESCDANHVLSWPVYASGSPNNVFRISLLSLNYKNEDFDYTASVGHQSIPIQPKPDKWYSNP